LVVGFDVSVAQHLTPPTTVRVDKEAIGAWVVRRLLTEPSRQVACASSQRPAIQRETVKFRHAAPRVALQL
jgi:DNA-binding LacI/PurR family transcriptional regulator